MSGEEGRKLAAAVERLRALDALAARHRALLMMDQVDSIRIAMLLDDFNALQE